MLSQVFHSLFEASADGIAPLVLLICLLANFGLGFLLSLLYQQGEGYSKDFAMTLVVLPALIAVIIFLVNGNLGTSVAVAGAFSLIKFRSPASSSRELLLVFMATALGLATGMGYLWLALLMTLVVGSVLLVLDKSSFAKHGANWQHITVKIPQSQDHSQKLYQLLETLGKGASLETATAKHQQLELTYRVYTTLSDQDLLHRLLHTHPTWEIKLSRGIKKKKSL